MKHIQSAYGRALLPGRYAPRDGDAAEAAPVLSPGGLELDLAAGAYRLISRVEGALDAVRGRLAGRHRPEGLRTAPDTLGCG